MNFTEDRGKSDALLLTLYTARCKNKMEEYHD
jgi:hypothetical protein